MSQLSQSWNLPPEIAALSADWQEAYLNASLTLTRKELAALSGSAFKASTLANRDSLGTGPAKRRRAGNKVVYPRDAAILWLAKEMKELPAREPRS